MSTQSHDHDKPDTSDNTTAPGTHHRSDIDDTNDTNDASAAAPASPDASAGDGRERRNGDEAGPGAPVHETGVDREPEKVPGTDLILLTELEDEVLDQFGGVDPRLGRFLQEALVWKASDLHLTAGRPPMVRVDGTIRPRDATTGFTPDDIRMMLRTTMNDLEWEIFERDRQVDYSLSLGNLGRFRVNAYHQLDTPAAAFRAIPDRVPRFDELGLRPEVARVTEYPYGLVLFVGPTGSGKTTTQAALINTINHTKWCHILTLEDPIEYLHPRGTAMVNQREVGTDVKTFQQGLRAAMREDPDVILLGEMRDEESISITLTLAETGHLVFATLHTNDAAQAVDRIIDSYPAERRDQIQTQLSGALQAVVSQRLLPKVGGGRAIACEVMIANDAVRNLIREGKTRQLRNVVATSSQDGMCTIESSLDALVQTGTVAWEDAVAISQHPKEIRQPHVAQAIANAEALAANGGR